MKVKELIKDFEDERRPYVSAAAFLGVHPKTISVWENKDGEVPPQWAALYREKKQKEVEA